MLSEVAIAGIYLPPFFIYACVAVPLFLGLRSLLARSGLLLRVWHPALFEFAISLCLISIMILYV